MICGFAIVIIFRYNKRSNGKEGSLGRLGEDDRKVCVQLGHKLGKSREQRMSPVIESSFSLTDQISLPLVPITTVYDS